MEFLIGFILGFFVSTLMCRSKIAKHENDLKNKFSKKESLYLGLLARSRSNDSTAPLPEGVVNNGIDVDGLLELIDYLGVNSASSKSEE